ncbi:Arginine-binding extracellular protein ArtP precursor [Nocardioides dokdonensis FR1436]|uniref:Arginine-binding extracellular protein ArtP n=1 Tax=Nocardioides dokdonensis FR1436 TaxID=1300347 RepID=A0A1A9GJC7_9ACTN|nr:ABC transporter substrate-binding protein [Nocardioides dokdonensis]ANH37575.1 Arginine-binding extracellular protein ArtP precursor [Nocardioides dokdonensis FR1436]
MLRRSAVVPALASLPLLLGAVACAPADEEPTASDPGASASVDADVDPATCVTDDMLLEAGTLTVGTDTPAYEPWFTDNDPTNGEGFESAVAYAVAERLGFGADEVSWARVPFNTSYAPGAKDFDFDINQISITPKRAEVVDFSTGYYQAAQAVIALEGTAGAEATSLADLQGLRLGAQTGTTSLTAIRDIVQPETDPAVFEDTNAAKQALANDQIDAVLADLPTAFYISAVEIEGSTIVGQFQPDTGEQEEFGILLEKDSALTSCVDAALAAMQEDGELEDLEREWLSDVVDVPTLQ